MGLSAGTALGLCVHLVCSVLAAVTASRGCRFPSRWTGTWFQKGVHPPIRIEGDTFSFKGFCVASEGDMFLIEDKKERCFRCVSIYEKHPNVLQYRETYCDEHRTLHEACSTLNGDTHLYSIFRVDAAPVACPFRGPFTFTYSRGHGECDYPISTVDTCTDDTRLLFRFQACADVLGTESSVEELTCLATWKEGSAHYIVGKLDLRKHYGPVFGEDDNYRCFVYDHLTDRIGYQVSQSADATCDGLVSPKEGSRIMMITKSKHPSIGCSFPNWVTAPHRWHTLDGRRSYVFGHKNTTLRILYVHSEHLDTKVTCTEEVALTSNSSTVVAYSMAGCVNGYICLTFHKRDNHILEIQAGDFARRPQDACHAPFYDPSKAEFVTLVTPSTASIVCPRLVETNGLRVNAGGMAQRHHDLCRDTGAVVVGCRSRDTLEFWTTCATFKDRTTFQCHGGWEESGKNYLITELKGSRAKYCFVYSSSDKQTQVSGLHDTCHRSILPGVTGNMTFNISAAGDCNYFLNSAATRAPLLLLTIIVTSIALRR